MSGSPADEWLEVGYGGIVFDLIAAYLPALPATYALALGC